MIKYNASDIISRARQIADLENSDFISWNEDIKLLNENYTSLYQKLINKGDKSFLKQIQTSDAVTVLPADFWQLKGVYVYNNGNLIPILRRAENQSLNSLYYEIKGNELYINGPYARSFIIEYFPVPFTLSYPVESKEIEVIGLGEPVDCAGNRVLFLKKESSSAKLTVYDFKKDTVFDAIEIDTTTDVLTFARLFKGGVVYCLKKNDTFISTAYFLMRKSSVTISDIERFIISESGNLYVISENGTIKSLEGIVKLSLLNAPAVFDVGSVGISDDSLVDIYFYIADEVALTSGVYQGTVYYKGTFSDIVCKCPHYKNGGIFYASDYAFFYAEALTPSEIEAKDNIVAVGPLNDSTGFDVIGINEAGGYSLESCLPDTELNFPNSFYFNLLAFYMAYSYKSKQGSDTTQISALIEQNEMTFFDTLGNDDYGVTRITNVY